MEPIQFGWVFGSEFHKTFHVYTPAFQYAFGEKQRYSCLYTWETIGDFREANFGLVKIATGAGRVLTLL